MKKQICARWSSSETYKGLEPRCCSGEPGWSSSARCHGNGSVGSELGSSLVRRRSSVSPRHWLGKGTERTTPSDGRKGNRQQPFESSGSFWEMRVSRVLFTLLQSPSSTPSREGSRSAATTEDNLCLWASSFGSLFRKSHMRVILTTLSVTLPSPDNDGDKSLRRMMKTWKRWVGGCTLLGMVLSLYLRCALSP